tara:strand:- start:356 stop:1099 length:744 start_codon:yes stop_codon:yes gene_type:complete
MKITRRQLRRLIREVLTDVDIEMGYSEPDVGTVTVGEYLLQSKYSHWIDKMEATTDEEERRDIAHDFIAKLSDDLYDEGASVMDPDDGSKIEPWHRGRWDSEEAVTARRDMEFSETLSDYIKDLMNKRATEVDYIQAVIDAAQLEEEAQIDIDHSELEEELDTILLGLLHVPGWHDEGGQGPWEDWGHPYLRDEESALSQLQDKGLTPQRAEEYIDEFMEWATKGTGKSSMVGAKLDQALIDYEQSS